MKLVFQIEGEADVNGSDLSDNLQELNTIIEDHLRTFADVTAKYKVIATKDEWIKL